MREKKPTRGFKSWFTKTFPQADIKNIRILRKQTSAYNCIAYALGFPRWLNASTIQNWRHEAFCVNLQEGEKLALYYRGDYITHMAKYQLVGKAYKWVSKIGRLELITHELKDLENMKVGGYGKVKKILQGGIL